MKKWRVILGTMVALVMTASVPLSALAQSAGETTADGKSPFKGSLAIVAPRGVPIGKEMSLGVFQRENQKPVPGAGVWALTRDSAEALKKEADALRNKNAEDTDYEALLAGRGSFLGRTGGDGRLFYTFKEAGHYVLVAVKKGYVPDFSPIVVRGTPANALVVSAPRMSPPDESVTITVTEKPGGEPVKEAGVWALTRENAEDLKSHIAGVRPAENSSIDLEALLNGRGIFLGTTHGNGELKYKFEKEGRYILVAVKKGYTPGYTGIAIVAHNTTKPSGKPNLTPRANEKANPGNGPTNNSTANSTRVK